MTTPIFTDERLFTTPPPSHDDDETDTERVRRLEDEVVTLRDTMSRFAELVLGQLKEIRKAESAPGGAPGAVPVPDLPLPSDGTKRPWLLLELFRDFTTTLRMYLDPRYRVRRPTQLLVPIILGSLLVNIVFFNWIFAVPVISTVLEKTSPFSWRYCCTRS
jgi:hypothetical protein